MCSRRRQDSKNHQQIADLPEHDPSLANRRGFVKQPNAGGDPLDRSQNVVTFSL